MSSEEGELGELVGEEAAVAAPTNAPRRERSRSRSRSPPDRDGRGAPRRWRSRSRSPGRWRGGAGSSRPRSRSRSRSPRGRRRWSPPPPPGRRPSAEPLPPPPPPPPPKSPTPELDDGTLADRAEAALAGADEDEEAAALAAEAAARAARRAAILAKHGGGGRGGDGAARAQPPPPPPPPQPLAAADEEMAAADADADGIGERRPAPGRLAGVPLSLSPPGGGGGGGGGKGGGGGATPDMFADDDGDVGGADGFGGGGAGGRRPSAPTSAAAATAALADAFDDAEGYYRARVGEVIAGRYEVSATLGAGVFATVVRARDSGVPTPTDPSPPLPGGEAALKIIRANDLMAKAAALEASILRKLAAADPGGKRHCVRLWSSFEHRGHAVLAFPAAAGGNLRSLAKRYGRGVGLALPAVRAYTSQLLLALAHCRNCGVIHADVKPDNILVEDGAASVLLADFGSAMWAGGGNALTPYLASRFYRPPEVILGLPYDHPVDAWALGCVAAELYTGKILFPGGSNNAMLALVMDAKGPLPARMVRRGAFAWKHYEGVPAPGCPPPPPGAALVFAQQTTDRATGKPARRLVPHPVAGRPLAARLGPPPPGASPADRRSLAAFADLLDRLLSLDPDRRITPRDALKHPFITGE